MVKRFGCTLILLCAAFQAQGAIITFDTLPGVIENGTYNGFVGTTVDGDFYNLICNDFNATTGVPSGPWLYNVSTLPSLLFARFGNDSVALAKYQQAALLLAGDGNTVAGLVNAITSYDITAYQYALWKLFDPSVDDVNNAGALLLTTLNDLSNGTDYGAIFSQLRVYTPTESAIENQEFLGLGDHTRTSIPEPGSSVLLATGLLVLGVMFRKRVRRSDSSV